MTAMLNVVSPDVHPRKRDVSPSTRSSDGCCSTASCSDLSDEESPTRQSSADDVFTALSLDSDDEKDWSLNVKNTFLNATWNGGRSVEESTSRALRRTSSMPPALDKESGRAMVSASPACLSRKHYEVTSDPVRPCSFEFLRAMNEKPLEAIEQMMKACLKPEVVMDVECCSNNQSTDVLSLQGAAQVAQLPSKLRDAIPDLMFELSSLVTEKWTGDGKGTSTRFTFTGTQRYAFFPMFPVGKRFTGEVHWEVLKRMNGAAIHYNWNFCAKQAAVTIVKELPLLPLYSINAHVLSLPLGDIVTPESTPRNATTVESPREATSEHLENLAESVLAPPAMQPVMVGMTPMFVPVSLPQPQPGMYNHAFSLQEEAQRAELAAASLRAQIKLEEAESQAPSHQELANGRARRTQRKNNKQSSQHAQPTSVMLRNMPLDLNRDMFLEMLDREGFMGSYDIIYLPRDFRTGANLGYAFVNLLTHDEAVRLQNHFTGFYQWSCRSAKRCEAAWSSHQGRAEYVDRYRNNPVMHESVPEDFKPAFFMNGVQVTFPAPTRKLKSPLECMQEQ